MKSDLEPEKYIVTEEELLLDIYYYKKGYETAISNDEKIDFKEKLEYAEELYKQLDLREKS